MGRSQPVQLNILINGGVVTPANVALQAQVGQSIDVHVSSDVEEWMLVEGEPPQKYWISVSRDEGFGFSLDKPGVATIKLERLGVTVATISVAPVGKAAGPQ